MSKNTRTLSLILFSLFGAALALGQGKQPEREAPKKLPADKSCTDCHDDWKAKRQVHPPECTDCHEQENEDLHAFTLLATRDKLCLECHDDLELEGHVHEPVKKGDCASCHEVHAADHPKLLRAPMKELCATCHEKLRAKAQKHVHGPYGLGLCQACHEPHASPNAKLLKGAGSALCLKCHDQLVPKDPGAATWHKPAKEDCGACHSGHETDQPYMLKAKQPDLCYACHKSLADRIARAKVRHKAVTEGSGCSGCHDPHVSSYARLLRTEAGNLCLTCHNKAYPQARKRPLPDFAKLLKEQPEHHGPVKDGNCEGCHRPHASPNFRLLKKTYPARFYDSFKPENYALCFGCHNKEVVLKERSTLTNFRDGDRNLHFLHVNRKKGRTCRACHATHASDAPHHIRKTTPFGSWDMPVGYRKTEGGGTCAPGCHVPQSYERGD